MRGCLVLRQHERVYFCRFYSRWRNKAKFGFENTQATEIASHQNMSPSTDHRPEPPLINLLLIRHIHRSRLRRPHTASHWHTGSSPERHRAGRHTHAWRDGEAWWPQAAAADLYPP